MGNCLRTDFLELTRLRRSSVPSALCLDDSNIVYNEAWRERTSSRYWEDTLIFHYIILLLSTLSPSFPPNLYVNINAISFLFISSLQKQGIKRTMLSWGLVVSGGRFFCGLLIGWAFDREKVLRDLDILSDWSQIHLQKHYLCVCVSEMSPGFSCLCSSSFYDLASPNFQVSSPYSTWTW